MDKSINWTLGKFIGLVGVMIITSLVIFNTAFDPTTTTTNSQDVLRQISEDPQFIQYFGEGLASLTKLDTDKDGIPDVSDNDIDNDGILNIDDTDVDGDGTPNESDPSSALVSLANQAGLRGEKGDTGDTGSAGADGSDGASGNSGENGSNGTAGGQGSAGTDGASGSGGAVGAQGPIGPQGASGTNGVTGATGANGANGANGADGTNGATGATGATGTVGVVTDDGVIDTTLTGSTLDIQLLLAAGSGLVKTGSGLSLDTSCSTNELLKWSGSAWVCSSDDGGITYSAGTGITISSGIITSLLGTTIETAEITDLNVTADKLATDSVTNVKIADNAVGTDELINSGVTYSKIQNITANSLFGNATGSSAAGSEIGLSTGLEFNSGSIRITAAVVNAIGSLDSQTKNSSGATISSNSLSLQTADATNPGLLSIGAQTIAGDKSFTGNTLMNGALTVDSLNNEDILIRTVTGGGSINIVSGVNDLNLNTFGGALNVGVGLTDKTITIGSGQGSSAININAGSSGLTVNSEVSITGGLTIAGATATQRGADYSATGSTNNVNFGNTSLVRLTGASAQTITGIAGGTDGKQLTIINSAGQGATISNQNVSSTAANRILTGTAADLTLAADASISLVYDSGANRWRVVGGTGGGGGSADASVAVANIATDTTIGASAGTTVDVANNINLNQTTTGRTLTLFSPTVTTAGKLVTVANTGTAIFTIYGSQIGAGGSGIFLWNGTAWAAVQANGSNVAAEFGLTPVTHNATFSTTLTDIAGSNFTLPSAGTYSVVYSISGYVSATANVSMGMYTSSNVLVPNSQVAQSAYPTNQFYGNTQTVIITVTEPTSFKLRGVTGGGTFTVRNTGTSDNASGNSNITWQKISGNTPVTGQTVDYLNGSLGGVPQSVVANTNITMTSVSGNIPISGGHIQLSAGKTYRLTAEIFADFSSDTDALTVNWVDNANAILPGQKQALIRPLNFAVANDSSGTADLVITPVSNMQVKLRSSASGPTIGTASVYSGLSSLNVVQLGSTASTGVTMSSLTAALSSNALDNGGNTQSWNWNGLGANSGLVIASTDASSTGRLQNITTATNAGTALAVDGTGAYTGAGLVNITANSITSGTGLSVNSASTAFTGSLASFSATGAGNTGNALTLSNTSANGLALNISSGALAMNRGTDYATSGTTNNVAFSNSSVIRLTGAGAQTITGIAGGSDGEMLVLINAGSSVAALPNESASSIATNRITGGSSLSTTIRPGGSAILIYDSGALRWRVVDASQVLAHARVSNLSGSGNNTGPAYGVITGAIEEYDTTNSLSGVTFTAPRTGYYQVSYQFFVASATCSAGQRFGVILQKGNGGFGAGSPIMSERCWTANPSNYTIKGSTTITLNAGDTLRPKAFNDDVAGWNISANAAFDFFSVSELP